jgi:hypothetical protein
VIRQRIRHSRTVADACDPQLRDRPAELSRALLDGEHGCADGEVYDFGHRYSVIDRNERLPQRLPELFMPLTRQANGRDRWPTWRSLSGVLCRGSCFGARRQRSLSQPTSIQTDIRYCGERT